jgi:hypothetical protein
MKRAGKVHFLVVAGIVGIVVVVALLLSGQKSPMTAADEFMRALAKGDVDTLVAMSYTSQPKDELREDWDFAVNKAGKYYQFMYKLKYMKQNDPNNAVVAMDLEKRSVGYAENFQLSMVKDAGEWKVDVRSISRNMFPALPR